LLPLQDPEAVALLADLPEAERLSSWRLARPDGSLSGRGRGGIDLLEAMTPTRRLGRALALVPDRALDGAYGHVARARGALGRLVPDGLAPRRFP